MPLTAQWPNSHILPCKWLTGKDANCLDKVGSWLDSEYPEQHVIRLQLNSETRTTPETFLQHQHVGLADCRYDTCSKWPPLSDVSQKIASILTVSSMPSAVQVISHPFCLRPSMACHLPVLARSKCPMLQCYLSICLRLHQRVFEYGTEKRQQTQCLAAIGVPAIGTQKKKVQQRSRLVQKPAPKPSSQHI